MTPLIRLVSRATLPIAVLISITHLVGAEDGPGDGFTAGIISSLGLTLEYLTFGYREAHRRFARIPFTRVLVFGVVVATVAAALPILTGGPLLAMRELELHVPLIGDIALTRSMLFDVGIYFVVLGGAMTAIDSLERAAE